MEKKKQTLWKYKLAFLPALLMVAVIFAFSSQDGVLSKETSGNLTKWILELLGKEIGGEDTAAVRKVEATDVLVRMWVHMAEYAVLSLCIGFGVSVNGVRGKLRFIYMVILGCLVALADEFYQIFVPGRYGDLADVLFDGAGIVVTALLWHIAASTFGKSKKNLALPEDKLRFINVTIDNITFQDALDRICTLAKKGNTFVVTPNVDHIIKVEKDSLFRKIYEKADLVLTDGTPLLWIAESMGKSIREKITGADMFPAVCERAAKEGLSVFLLGAAEGVAEKAVENLKEKYEGIRVAGTYSPKMHFEKDEKEVERILSIINKNKPDILVLALGSPKQEKFIYQYRDKMEFGVALCFGAAVDFAAGTVKRAPLWIRKIGMEWFYRFLCEPGRLFRRYFVDDMQIFALAWKYRFELQEKEK